MISGNDILLDMEARGFNRQAYLDAIASGDDDAMGITHPMLWLPEGSEDNGILDAVHAALKESN